MAAIPIYTGGEKPTAAQWAAPGRALQGLGITDDNGGDPISARSFALMLALTGSDATLASKVVTSGASYTVPASTLYVVNHYEHAAGVTDTVTPNGASAINLSTHATGAGSRPIFLILGPSDAIAMGAASYASGFLLALPSDVSRVLKSVTNASTHSVTAGKWLWLTHISAASAVGNERYVLNGVVGPNVPNAGLPITSIGYFMPPPQILKAGETVASNSANLLLISGIEFTN